MICVVQPFSSGFEPAFIWPLGGAFAYAAFIITTRFLGRTDSSESLAVYSTAAFLVTSMLMGLTVGDGSLANTGNLNVEFLVRAWRWPSGGDLGLIIATGGLQAVFAVAMATAYRFGEASFLAPFEYVNLPLVLFWGLIVFGEFPNVLGLAGMLLIVLGGMIMLFRERAKVRASRIIAV